MIFIVSFIFYMLVGIFGYAGWGDPINWGFLVPVAFVASIITVVIDPSRGTK